MESHPTERIRSLTVELLDRHDGISRAVASGPWPAIIHDQILWTPRRVLKGRISSGTVSGDVLTHIYRTWPQGMPREREDLRAETFVQETIQPLIGEAYAVEYGYRYKWDGIICGGPGPRDLTKYIDVTFLVLVDPERERGLVDTMRMAVFGKPLPLDIPVCSRAIQKRWAQLRLELDEHHVAVRAGQDAARAEKLALNKAAASALALHLQALAIRCPHCRRPSQDYRLLDNAPPMLSFFVCHGCGRSFLPEELA